MILLTRIEAMLRGTDDDGGAQPLLVVSAVATKYKPAGFKFRQLVLSIRFVLCLNRTRSPPPVHTVIDVIPLESEREIKKRHLKQLVKEENLEALDAFGGVQGVVSFLRSESHSPVTDFFFENFCTDDLKICENMKLCVSFQNKAF